MSEDKERTTSEEVVVESSKDDVLESVQRTPEEIEAELAATKEQLENEKKQRSASDKKIRELTRRGKDDSGVGSNVLLPRLEGLEKLVKLSMQRGAAGDFGAPEDLTKQLQAVESETATKLQAAQARESLNSFVDENLSTIEEIFEETGISMDEDSPEVAEIRDKFRSTVEDISSGKGGSFKSIITKASALAIKRAKGSVDKSAIDKKVKEELHEEKKKSIKVDKGSSQSNDAAPKSYIERNIEALKLIRAQGGSNM